MNIPSNKIKDIIDFFHKELKGIHEKEEVDIFIGLCFEAFLNFNKAQIIINSDKTISESELLKFNFAINDLKLQTPIQYILGKADFYKSIFLVNSSVLIPRPETEELVDLIIKENDVTYPSIIDIGTGSGCIAISLKRNIINSAVYAMDVSAEAITTAKENALLNNVFIEFITVSIFDDINLEHISSASLDIVVSNPPYVCITEKHDMQKNVLDYEPHLALFVPNNDPLLFYKTIADFALKYLKPGGKLYFEINPLYGEEMLKFLKNKGFKNLKLVKDLNNKNRILRGENPTL
ncbi:MAG: peptide chain release factor N(5)-glutamine methyltransferase [Bacteroidia bacterium]